MIKVIKRNGDIVDFNEDKIYNAILKAFNEIYPQENNKTKCAFIQMKVVDTIKASYSDDENISVETIQDLVENHLMTNYRDVAKAYIKYRYKRELVRQSNTTDKSILELIDGVNDYWNKENSNKNATLVTTQRDYLAGITSTDITERFLLPADVVKADKEGILHFHDKDYFAQHITNCCLVNLEDMLQNGTAINGVKIEKPHRLITATTITTQIITAVASSQYGGTSITLTHLAPFVRDSYYYHLKKYHDRGLDEERSLAFARLDTEKEIEDSVQTFNYQINSMSTTNGQTPFLTVFMYLGETDEYKNELAALIREFIKQRKLGLKNECGAYVTQSFPKLIYVLEEDNISENSRYWDITVEAAKCTAKRLVPDYISEKKMKELKEGNCFPSMGCVDGKEIITYKYLNRLYVESFERMWDRLSKYFPVRHQFDELNQNLYIDLKNVFIYDTKKGFVNTKRIIRNISNDWLDIKISNGRRLLCTSDHPFHTNRGRVLAKDLQLGDTIKVTSSQYTEENITIEDDLAWTLGFMLCDGCYQGSIFASIAAAGEDEIAEKFIKCMKKYFNLDVQKVFQKRGRKGTYNDLIAKANPFDKTRIIKNIAYFISEFGGINKKDRHIPNEVFEWNYTAKLAFLAGMIDADGYINGTFSSPVVQIGSTNKELALQQMALAQATGMPARLYHNHYNSVNKNLIRYRVEFHPSTDVISYIQCEKKKLNYFKSNVADFHITAHTMEAITEINSIDESMYSYDVTTDSDHFEVSGIYSYNCRSFLAPYKDENDNYKFYGRLNQGVVTLNLVDIALSSHKNVDEFWKLFEERTELCHKALRCRHERLKGTFSDVAPILWQDGAFARLKKGEKIDKYLYGGYSSISLGYAGLYECVKYMTDHSHTDGGIGEKFGLEVMTRLNEKCEQWKNAENIGYSLYGSPIESTTYKFAKCLKKRFGIIEGITDKDYITNSYHVPVFEKIDPFKKLAIESKFQSLSLGGAISYVECADLQNNISAVLEVIKFIYDNIMYAELNTKSDYCQVCGYDGEINIIDENNQLIWECPNCGNRDQSKMNVTRRTCGYLGSNFWNQGRTQEIKERYVHLDNHEVGE